MIKINECRLLYENNEQILLERILSQPTFLLKKFVVKINHEKENFIPSIVSIFLNRSKRRRMKVSETVLEQSPFPKRYWYNTFRTISFRLTAYEGRNRTIESRSLPSDKVSNG